LSALRLTTSDYLPLTSSDYLPLASSFLGLIEKIYNRTDNSKTETLLHGQNEDYLITDMDTAMVVMTKLMKYAYSIKSYMYLIFSTPPHGMDKAMVIINMHNLYYHYASLSIYDLLLGAVIVVIVW